jgi:hypothetical protein
MLQKPVTAGFLCTASVIAGCQPSPSTDRSTGRAAEYARTVEALLLDTTLLELRGTLMRKVVNPNRDDESPLADSSVANVAPPGPHLHDGVMHADVEALTAVLGNTRPLTVAEDRVVVGTPPVLVLGHRHGAKLFVPVKLFARQYGAYVDIGCTPANCATIWTTDILRYMRAQGYTGSAGLLGAHAEGLVDSIDVHNLPRG